MQVILTLQVVIDDDGTIGLRPLGYVASHQGGPLDAESLAQLQRRIVERSANPTTHSSVPENHQPMRPPGAEEISTPLIPSASKASIDSAEKALVAFGMAEDSASQAVKQHGAKRIVGVCEWARRRMQTGGVRDVISLISTALKNNPGL